MPRRRRDPQAPTRTRAERQYARRTALRHIDWAPDHPDRPTQTVDDLLAEERRLGERIAALTPGGPFYTSGRVGEQFFADGTVPQWAVAWWAWIAERDHKGGDKLDRLDFLRRGARRMAREVVLELADDHAVRLRKEFGFKGKGGALRFIVVPPAARQAVEDDYARAETAYLKGLAEQAERRRVRRADKGAAPAAPPAVDHAPPPAPPTAPPADTDAMMQLLASMNDTVRAVGDNVNSLAGTVGVLRTELAATAARVARVEGVQSHLAETPPPVAASAPAGRTPAPAAAPPAGRTFGAAALPPAAAPTRITPVAMVV